MHRFVRRIAALIVAAVALAPAAPEAAARQHEREAKDDDNTKTRGSGHVGPPATEG